MGALGVRTRANNLEARAREVGVAAAAERLLGNETLDAGDEVVVHPHHLRLPVDLAVDRVLAIGIGVDVALAGDVIAGELIDVVPEVPEEEAAIIRGVDTKRGRGRDVVRRRVGRVEHTSESAGAVLGRCLRRFTQCHESGVAIHVAGTRATADACY